MDRLLIPGGLLFTGHTETNFWHQQGYLPVPWDRAFALTKPASSASRATVNTEPPAKPTSPNSRHGKIAVLPTDTTAKGKKPIRPYTGPPEAPSGKRQQTAKPGAANAGFKIPTTDAQIQEARRLADAGDTTGAARLCREYTRKSGPAAEAYCLLGILAMAGQDLNGAEECFLKALYLDPNHYESLVHISLIYRQKGKESKAALYRERAERKAAIKK
jgi:chemotaxis protein methyltransferase WspC